MKNNDSAEEDGDNVRISSNDQMKHIYRVLGNPKPIDKSFISDETALEYLNTLSKKKHSNKLH